MSLNRANQKRIENMARSSVGPHSPFSFNTERAQELRKSLFPSARRIPGRKVKGLILLGVFISCSVNYKINEIKLVYR